MKAFGFLISFFFTLAFQQAGAQNEFQNINLEKGLPSNETYEVFQDSKGYIWIATDHGVAKYDGNQLEIFTTNEGLPDNTIFRFYEDHHGRIWFFAFNGKLAYYQNDRIYQLDLPIDHSPNFIWGIAVDQDDTVTVKFRDRQIDYVRFKLGPNEHSINESFKFTNWANYGPPWGLTPLLNSPTLYASNCKYIVLNGKLMSQHCLNKDAMMFRSIRVYNRPISFGSYKNKNSFSYSHKDTANLVVTGSGIFNHQFYVCYVNGDIVFFDGTGKKLQVLNYPGFIPTSIIQDSQGGIWISTLNKGVLHKSNKSLSKHLFKSNLLIDGLVKCQTNGSVTLIANSKNEVYKWDHQSNKIELIGQYSSVISSIKSINGLFYFGANYVLMSFDSLGTFIESKRSDKYPFENDIELFSTYIDYEIGSNGLISCTQEWLFFNNNMVQMEGGKRLTTIATQNDTIWAGGNEGLFAASISQIKEIKLDSGATIKDRIEDLVVIQDRLIMATRGKGLGVKIGSNIQYINRKSGLSSNLINKILVDSTNIIWTMSNAGVSRITFTSFDPLEYKIDNLGKEDGIYDRKINDIQLFDDSILILTDFSLYKLPKRYNKKLIAPLLHLSKVTANDSIEILNNAILNHSQKNVRFTFVPIYHPNPEGVSLQYSFNDGATWTTIESKTIDFPNLGSAKYKLQVRAINTDGVASKAIPFHFEIKPPFWFTWWFILLEILCAFGLAFLLYRYLLRQQRIKTRMIGMELKALRSQMNPHFTFNSMTSIQAYVLDNKPEDALNFITKYSKLTRTILNNSMQDTISLEEEMDALVLYMDIENIRMNSKFTYTIEMDEEIEPDFIYVPSMILQPYVENSIWHGLSKLESDGNILFQFSLEGNILKCAIQDNGIGRKAAQEFKNQLSTNNKSHGMNITRNRLDLINSMDKKKMNVQIIDLYDDNQNPIGTRIEIQIDIHN